MKVKKGLLPLAFMKEDLLPLFTLCEAVNTGLFPHVLPVKTK